MQVVIEIDDIDYEAIKHGKPISAKVMDALIHGTPLPKGHGDLIDRSELNTDNLDRGFDDNFELHYGQVYLEDVDKMIENAPTIIEADKEGDEE